ncbi:hypothetical protein A9Q91_04440 [Candidatus Gracilibacteria bacterium 28_42_T64]|nr:hypothetical protein A9Q91_04440 [Candidatus Gracilibacteria bacterium 28_42_T64]
MKLTRKLILSVIPLLFLGYSSVLAAGIDHFEVKLSPESAEVGEPLDLIIEAVDKNNAIVTDYNGTILIFSESDPETELPTILDENTYVFSDTDQGKITFENAVKFKAAGTQDMHIYDLNDDTVLGVAEVQITQKEVEENIDIDILSPENGLTIGENKINISGTTKKNHTIKIIINGTTEVSTTSNDSGLYEKALESLIDGENTIKTQVLNADEEVVGESEEIKIQVESNLPQLKNIKLTPSEVDPESGFEIEIIANKGLVEVSVVIDDVLTKLEETEEGIYKANIFSPKKAGSYKIDTVLKDELGHETKELGSSNLVVNESEHNAADIEKETETPVVINEEDPEIIDIKISGLKLTKLKSKSVLTWDQVSGAENYAVYKKLTSGELEFVENVVEPRFEIEITGDEIQYEYFAVKVVTKTASGELVFSDPSEITKIQTGPEILILFILSLFIGGFIFMTKRKA